MWSSDRAALFVGGANAVTMAVEIAAHTAWPYVTIAYLLAVTNFSLLLVRRDMEHRR
jgi:hypothetical protein